MREVVSLGYNAIFLTVDAPFPGNRGRDVRAGWKIDDLEKLAKQGKAENVDGGVAKELPRSEDDLDDVDDPDTTGTAGKLIANDDVDMTWHEVRKHLGGGMAEFIKASHCAADHSLAAADNQTPHRAERNSMRRSMSIVTPNMLRLTVLFQDAVLAAEAGVDGILLSNHGGRQLD